MHFEEWELDEHKPRKPKYTRCRDGFCGAEDCSRCRPGNFRGGVYVGDLEDEKEVKDEH